MKDSINTETNKKKILLTGGSGYIGSHTLLELAKKGEYQLSVFDNFKNGHKEAINRISQETNQEITIIEGDLLNYDQINRALADIKPDGVIHFAALIEAGKSMETPTKFFDNNISGSINLIKAMQENNVHNIIFSSTAAVYGTPKDTLVTEDSKVQPENWYGYTKSVIEQLLRAVSDEGVSNQEKINVTVLRYFNAAGANPDGLIGQDYPKPTHLITVALETALGKREKLTVFGNDYPTKDGTCIRDYIHVEDLATAHVLALDTQLNSELSQQEANNKSQFRLYNVGTKSGYSNLEVIQTIEEIHGKFNWEFGPRRPGDPAGYYADNTKIKKELNWEPKYNLKQTIEHAYNWLKNNPNGYNK